MTDQMRHRVLATRIAWTTIAVISVLNVIYISVIVNYLLFSNYYSSQTGDLVFGSLVLMMCILTFVMSGIVSARITGRMQGRFVATSYVIVGVIAIIATGLFIITPSAIIYLPFAAALLFLSRSFKPRTAGLCLSESSVNVRDTTAV